MTARYFFGNTLASFFRSSTSTVEVTTSGKFDSTYVANAIAITAGFIQTVPFIDASSTTTLWTHLEISATGVPSGTNTTPFIEWVNSSGVSVLRIQPSTGSTNQFQYWNGSAWVNIGSTFTFLINTIYRLDIKIIAGVSGSFEVFSSGSSIASGSGFNAAVTNFAAVRIYTWSPSATMYISQVLGADFDTRDSRYMASLANANGNYTNGTGAYTDINETVLDESTSITLTTSGHKKTFTKPSITLPPGYVIDTMCVSGRARVNGSISDGKMTIRSSSTDASSGGLAYNAGYEPRGAYFANDPATATRFTQSGYNAAEFGLEAV